MTESLLVLLPLNDGDNHESHMTEWVMRDDSNITNKVKLLTVLDGNYTLFNIELNAHSMKT